MKTLRVLLASFFIVALSSQSSVVYGQSNVGRISGTVFDTSGAVVPGASVTVSNPTTGFKQEVVTQEKGLFVFPGLAPGTYNVEAALAGFATVRQQGIVLDASSTRTLQFTLSVGALTDTVSVSAETQQVQTTSGDVSRTIDDRQVSQTAMNGRNLDQLLRLIPGAISQDGAGVAGAAGTNPFDINVSADTQRINGSTGNSINFTVDGISNTGAGSKALHSISPNVDAVSEVRVLASSYAAEFGGQMGAQISVVTKSGGRDFHGSLFHFFRNDKLDSRSFFATKKDPLHFNDFGGTLGGPITIPGKFNPNRNKLFFFFSEEAKYNHTGLTQTGTVPTAEERAGNFQNSSLPAPVDPLTGLPFPDRIVPESRWSKNGPLLLKPIPLPNRSGTTNFALTAANIYESRQDLFKIDFNANDKLQLAFRYIHDDWNKWEEAFAGGNLGIVPGLKGRPGQIISGTANSVFTTATVNSLTYGITSDTVNGGAVEDKITRTALGLTFPEVFPVNIFGVGPGLTMTGFTGYNLSTGIAFHRIEHTYSLRDDLTSVKGPHILKFGFLYLNSHSDDYPPSGSATQGAVSFSTATSKTSRNVIADVLLGNFRTYTESEFATGYYSRNTAVEFYAQDTWKASRKLTLDYGLRYSLMPPNWNALGTAVSFEPSRFNPALAPSINPSNGNIVPGGGDPYNGMVFWGDGWPDAAKGLVPQYENPSLDRLFVDLPKGGAKTVYRNFAPRFGFAYDILGDGKMALRGGGGLFFDRAGLNSFDAIVRNPPISSSVSIQDGNIDQPAGGVSQIIPPSVNNNAQRDVARNYNANVSVQRELPGRIIADVGYVGTFGRHLGSTAQLNALRPGTLTGANASVNPNALRPYLGYGAISYAQNNGKSNYHSLQMSASRRVSQGLSFGGSFAWSKTTELANAQDTYQPMEWALSGIHRAKVGSLNFQYDLPGLDSGNALLRGVAGGWAIAGVVLHQDGAPNSVTVTGDIARNGSSSSRATLKSGEDLYLPSDQRTTDHWFNTNAFLTAAEMPVGQFGTSGRNILIGPGLDSVDLSLSKVFKPAGSTTLQFRVECFNALNHASFTGLNTTVGTATFGAVTGSGPGRVFALGFKLLY